MSACEHEPGICAIVTHLHYRPPTEEPAKIHLISDILPRHRDDPHAGDASLNQCREPADEIYIHLPRRGSLFASGYSGRPC